MLRTIVRTDRRFPKAPWLVSAALALALSGCLLAAAGAGAAGAVYITDRGAEALISASVDETFEAARETFQEMSITQTEMSQTDGGDVKRELDGRDQAGDRQVSVTMERDGSNTRVQVTAQKSAVTWDKDYARSVLERIVEKAGD